MESQRHPSRRLVRTHQSGRPVRLQDFGARRGHRQRRIQPCHRQIPLPLPPPLRRRNNSLGHDSNSTQRRPARFPRRARPLRLAQPRLLAGTRLLLRQQPRHSRRHRQQRMEKLTASMGPQLLCPGPLAQNALTRIFPSAQGKICPRLYALSQPRHNTDVSQQPVLSGRDISLGSQQIQRSAGTARQPCGRLSVEHPQLNHKELRPAAPPHTDDSLCRGLRTRRTPRSGLTAPHSRARPFAQLSRRRTGQLRRQHPVATQPRRHGLLQTLAPLARPCLLQTRLQDADIQ